MSEKKKDKGKIQIRVINTNSLDDITEDLEKFEFVTDHMNRECCSMTVHGKDYSLVPTRIHPKNNVYSIKMTDDQGNELHRMMEVK